MRTPRQTLALKPRIVPADECLRPTRAEVDLGALAHNLRTVRSVLGKTRILAVVKADAYGHGVVPVAARLETEGVDGFGVALAEEALELREAGIAAPILVLNGVYGGAHRAVIAAGISPVVYDLHDVEAFHRASFGRPVGVHLKIDTGMARLGVPVGELDAFLDSMGRFGRVRIEGVMTHLAAAGTDEEVTQQQLTAFRRALWRIRGRGHRPHHVHAANSAGMLHEDARFDMVRPGLALFGLAEGLSGLEPVLRLRTELIAVRTVEARAPIGYDAAFRAPRRMNVATVPMGYGDGLLRASGAGGVMLVHGKRCPIVGRVSMDLTTIDVTDVPQARVGDEAVVLGEQGDERLTATELARVAGTVSYEVLTNVSRRVPRFYR